MHYCVTPKGLLEGKIMAINTVSQNRIDTKKRYLTYILINGSRILGVTPEGFPSEIKFWFARL